MSTKQVGWSVGWLNCCWPFASTVNLGFGSCRDPWPYFLSKAFTCFEMEHPLQQQRGQTVTGGHSYSTGVDRSGHSLTNCPPPPFLSLSDTHTSVNTKQLFLLRIYTKTHFIPHRKHITSLLQKPTGQSCSREESLFTVRTIWNTYTLCGPNAEF
jgi:hypothetical protein